MMLEEGSAVPSRRSSWKALRRRRSFIFHGPSVISVLLTVVMVVTAFVAASSTTSVRVAAATGIAVGSLSASAQPDRTISLHIEASPAQASITVQGLIAAPPNSGVRGFVTVFEGKTTDGIYQLTSADILRLDQVTHDWTSYLGVAAERISTPQVFALVMGDDSSGLYVRQVTVPLTAWQVYSGFSGELNVPVSFGATPVLTTAQIESYMVGGVTPSLPLAAGLPCPYGECTCSITSGGCYESIATYCYPSGCGTGEIPVAFAQFWAYTYGEIVYSMVSSGSTFGSGMVAGTGPGVSSPAFSPGASVWSTTATFGQTWDCSPDTTCYDNGGEGYIYLDATMDMEEWQYYECSSYNTHTGTCEGFKATNDYVWNSGMVSPQTNCAGGICGGQQTGFPAYWSSSTQYLTNQVYGGYTGTGGSQPAFKVYSNAFVTTYAQSDYGWVSMATDALGFISESLPIVGSIVANLLGAATAGSSSTSLAWVEFDGWYGTPGAPLGLEVWTSSTSYDFPGGYGEVPLFAVYVT